MGAQILITGATGFIGRQLTHDLVAHGNNVRALVRDDRKARKLFGTDVELSLGDVTDPAAVNRACRGIDVIYHIAGTYRFGLRHHRELWQVNVDGAENIFRSAFSAGVAKVVHLSSGGLLSKNSGAPTYSPLLDENDYPIAPPSFSPYKFSKWHSEQRALAWAHKGLPVVIASTTCPIGTGDEAPTPTGRMIHDFLQRKFPFYCHTSLNFIDVRDLSQGLQAAAHRGEKGRRYLICQENLWLKEFLDLLSEETGLPAPAWCLPHWAIQLAGYGGEVVDLLNPHSTGARICLETAFQSQKKNFFNNAVTRHDLDWKPLWSIRDSIRQAVAWYLQNAEIEIPLRATPRLESSIR